MRITPDGVIQTMPAPAIRKPNPARPDYCFLRFPPLQTGALLDYA